MNDWAAFKSWLQDWVLGNGISDTELTQLYLDWLESDEYGWGDTTSMSEETRAFVSDWFSSSSCDMFNKSEKMSGLFWIFAAYAELRCMN